MSQERKSVYIAALKEFDEKEKSMGSQIEYFNSLCPLLAKFKKNIPVYMFKEFHAQLPIKKYDSIFWFAPTVDGRKQRRQVLLNCIKSTHEKG